MDQRHHHSHLFTLRLWPAPRADGEIAWRAKATHVLSGETRYFREWAPLIGFLEETGGLTAASPPVIGKDGAPGANADIG